MTTGRPVPRWRRPVWYYGRYGVYEMSFFYLNGMAVPLILPYECLEALNCPRYIQVMLNEADRRIAIRELEEESTELYFDIQEEHYQEMLPLAIYGDGFGLHLQQLMGWKIDTPYLVEYEVRRGPGGERVLVANLDEAQEAVGLPEEPYMFCGWQEAAILAQGIETEPEGTVVDSRALWKSRMTADQFRHYNARRRRGR